MKELFFEKYSTKLSHSSHAMEYSHELQRNISFNNAEESTFTKSEGEASDFDDMIYSNEITYVTENEGEAKDVDEIHFLDSTKGTDEDGEATDEVDGPEWRGTRR